MPATETRPTPLMKLKTPASPETQALHKAFADRLTQLMKDKGYTQSALAREIWGSMKDGRGYDVARNRDRISAYLAGAGLPEPENLRKLADALNCSPEDLVGAVGIDRPLTRARPATVDVQLATVIGRPGMMQVSLNMIMPTSEAMKVVAIAEAVRAASDEDDEA